MPPSFARWVNIDQWVVQAVGISIETLRIAGALHIVVHREEAAGEGVVHSSVHVDETEIEQVLVSGEAAVEEQGGCGFGARGGEAVGRTPGIEAHIL